MDRFEVFGVLAGAIGTIAWLPYLGTAIFGETKPSQASWCTWGLVMTVAVISQWYSGAAWQVVLSPLIGSSIAVSIAVVSIWRGDKDWGPINLACVVIACAAVLVLLTTKRPQVALMMTILADALGFIPTLRHAWSKPWEENRFTWFLGTLAAILCIFAVENYNFANMGWTVYYSCAMFLTFIVIAARYKVVVRR